MTTGPDEAFPAAAAIALDLIALPEVAERWSEPSALPRMSVGALACHLGRQPVRAAELLPLTPGGLPVLGSVDAHYHRAAWVRATSPDDPVNDRSADDADAALGPAALLERTASALEMVRQLLRTGAAEEVVPVPWQGWALHRRDFLLTRLVEVVVHSDDLAASLGVATPEFPEEAFAPVRDLLVRLAVERHGQSALIGTLARAERTRPISAF
ncbi:maleylpyruvate isomerase N-terminal domain-containing protein [Geodermatophilus sp. SYSU D00815]